MRVVERFIRNLAIREQGKVLLGVILGCAVCAVPMAYSKSY